MMTFIRYLPRAVFVSVVLSNAVTGFAAADAIFETQKLLPSDGEAGDVFGQHTALSGDRALIGADSNEASGNGAGSVYLFERDVITGRWNEITKLLASDGSSGDFFGWPIALEGDRALIGSSGDDDNGPSSGSVYLFERDGTTGSWSELAKLLASDGAAADGFGTAIALSGDRALIGAHGDDDNGDNSGSAYLFERQNATGNWIEVAKLLPGDGAAGDNFGEFTALDGDIALVASPRGGDGGVRSGAVYVFEQDAISGSWTETAKLLASDREGGELFGGAIALSGNRAVIGAWLDDDKGINSGSVYIFERSSITGSWSEVAKLLASDGAASDYFGDPIAILGNRILIGATGDDGNTGSAYVFESNVDTGNWVEIYQLFASDAATGDIFGWPVTFNGVEALVGATYDDDNGSQSGAVYVFSLADSDGDGVLDTEDNCRLTPNSDQADKDGDGIGDVCDAEGPSGKDDPDGDGVLNRRDNCPFTPNPDQADTDGDGTGDLCDDTPADPDTDMDGWIDSIDNCLLDFNPGQEDQDGDGVGDACDDDIDGDEVPNKRDKCPLEGERDFVDRKGCPLN